MSATPIISNTELRKHKHKLQRPCSRAAPEGRKFFDWSVEFVNVDVNYNYNYNCGGGGAPGTSSSSLVQAGGVGSHLSQKPPHGNGLLGLGLLSALLGGGTSSGASSSSSSSASAGAGVASPPVRPVTEVPQDEVLPDRIGQLRPGTYATASNPFFGSYTYNLSSNRILQQVDKGIDWLLTPLWNLL